MTVHITPNNPQYRIIEAFESLQSKDWNIGIPAVFIRLGKCDFVYSWYDTDYLKFGMMSLSSILGRPKTYTARSIIITGGEPTVQPHLDTLLNALKAEGYFLCIKTSGLNPAPSQIDHVATSPKVYYAARYEKNCIERADGVRIVANGEVIAFCQEVERKIRARRYYLLPCKQDGAIDVYDTIRQIGVLNSRTDAPVYWQLNVQAHKWAGVE